MTADGNDARHVSVRNKPKGQASTTMELQEHRRCSQLYCGSTYYICNLQYFKPSRRRAEQAALLCRPVFADLADLPPVMLVIGTDDILLEDNLVWQHGWQPPASRSIYASALRHHMPSAGTQPRWLGWLSTTSINGCAIDSACSTEPRRASSWAPLKVIDVMEISRTQ